MLGMVFGAAMTAPLLVSGSASASTVVVTPAALNGCANHSLCLYSGTNYLYNKYTYTYGGNGGSGLWNYVGAAANDQAWSLIAYRTDWTLIGDNYPLSGPWMCIRGIAQLPDLNSYDYPGYSISVAGSISSYALTSGTNTACP